MDARERSVEQKQKPKKEGAFSEVERDLKRKQKSKDAAPGRTQSGCVDRSTIGGISLTRAFSRGITVFFYWAGHTHQTITVWNASSPHGDRRLSLVWGGSLCRCHKLIHSNCCCVCSAGPTIQRCINTARWNPRNPRNPYLMWESSVFDSGFSKSLSTQFQLSID